MASSSLPPKPPSFLGHRHTSESNEKNRLAHVGKKASRYTRAKMGTAHKARWADPAYRERMLAMRRTPEFRERARQGMLGKKNSLGCKRPKELRARISAALTGRPGHAKGVPASATTRAKISASLTGKKQSKATRKKRARSLRGRKLSPELLSKWSISHMKYANVACAVSGCGIQAIAKGFCGRHWKSNRKYGDPTFAWSAARKKTTHAKLLLRPIPGHRKRVKYRHWVFRSSYEVRFVKLLNRGGVKWEYEPRRFELGNIATYTPDFYLPEYDLWCEVKGWMTEYAERKIELFHRFYPDYRLIVIPAQFFIKQLDAPR